MNPYQHLFDEDPEEDPTYQDPEDIALDLAVHHNYKTGPIMGMRGNQAHNPRRRPR
jgi:hypothetical protein